MVATAWPIRERWRWNGIPIVASVTRRGVVSLRFPEGVPDVPGVELEKVLASIVSKYRIAQVTPM